MTYGTSYSLLRTLLLYDVSLSHKTQQRAKKNWQASTVDFRRQKLSCMLTTSTRLFKQTICS